MGHGMESIQAGCMILRWRNVGAKDGGVWGWGVEIIKACGVPMERTDILVRQPR